MAERAKAGDASAEDRAAFRAAPPARRDAGGAQAGAGVEGAGRGGAGGRIAAVLPARGRSVDQPVGLGLVTDVFAPDDVEAAGDDDRRADQVQVPGSARTPASRAASPRSGWNNPSAPPPRPARSGARRSAPSCPAPPSSPIADQHRPDRRRIVLRCDEGIARRPAATATECREPEDGGQRASVLPMLAQLDRDDRGDESMRQVPPPRPPEGNGRRPAARRSARPTNPVSTAAQRCQPVGSRSTSAPRIVAKIGTVNCSVVASASGSSSQRGEHESPCPDRPMAVRASMRAASRCVGALARPGPAASDASPIRGERDRLAEEARSRPGRRRAPRPA